MRDRWDLKRPPCSKWGMKEKVLRTTASTKPGVVCSHSGPANSHINRHSPKPSSFFLPPPPRYQDVLHSIHLARKGNPGLKTCDGHQELLKYMRSDILEVASRLQKGGLGYMDDTSEFEEKVRGSSWAGEPEWASVPIQWR